MAERAVPISSTAPATGPTLNLDTIAAPPSDSVWSSLTNWVADHKAVAYTVGAVVIVVTGAGAVYYFNSAKATGKKGDTELGDEKSEAGKKKKRKAKKDKKGDKSGDSDDGAAGMKTLFWKWSSASFLSSSLLVMLADTWHAKDERREEGKKLMLQKKKFRKHLL